MKVKIRSFFGEKEVERTEEQVANCTHENAEFVGVYSFVGNYHCQDCGKELEPVDYHRLMGLPHRDIPGSVEAWLNR